MAIDTRFCLKCALVNIQSVGNKTCEICDYINDNKLDILMLAETWLNNYDSAKIREMTPDMHTLLHISSGDRRGGGVGIFISKSFSKIRKEKVPKMTILNSSKLVVENESAKYLIGPNCSVFKKRLKMHVFADCYQSGDLNLSYRV